MIDGRIVHDDLTQRLLKPPHRGGRDVLCGLGNPAYQSDILLWKKSLGDDDEQINGERDGSEKYADRDEAKSQHEIETTLVCPRYCVEAPLAQRIKASMMIFLWRLEKTRGHHRGQRQRDESRYQDGHR